MIFEPGDRFWLGDKTFMAGGAPLSHPDLDLAAARVLLHVRHRRARERPQPSPPTQRAARPPLLRPAARLRPRVTELHRVVPLIQPPPSAWQTVWKMGAPEAAERADVFYYNLTPPPSPVRPLDARGRRRRGGAPCARRRGDRRRLQPRAIERGGLCCRRCGGCGGAASAGLAAVGPTPTVRSRGSGGAAFTGPAHASVKTHG